MEQPLITIAITCFNAERTIARAIESALAQRWTNKEILIVDDGSKDGSVKILNDYAAKSTIISVILHKENEGCPTARNTLLKNAKGEYFVFFDDDDFSYPNRLEEQFRRLTAFEADGRVALCYANLEIVKVGEDQVCRIAKGTGWAPKEPHGELIAESLLLEKEYSGYTYGHYGAGTMMARRLVLDVVGGYDAEMMLIEDWDYAIRMGLNGGYCISVDKPLVRQYLTKGTDKTHKRMLHSQRHLMIKNKAYLSKNGMYVFSLLMSHARAYEFVGNRFLFKIYRSLAKRIKKLCQKKSA
jgi:glycosyltransferase involved in cell wall biosynthesis